MPVSLCFFGCFLALGVVRFEGREVIVK